MVERKPTACILCSENCGLDVITENGHIIAFALVSKKTSNYRFPIHSPSCGGKACEIGGGCF